MNESHHTTSFKHLLYTIVVFIFLVLASYVAFSQQKLSMKDAVSLAIKNNREVRISKIEVEKAQEQVKIANSMRLPKVYAGAQVSHYFTEPAFFGFSDNANSNASSKIPYSRFGGRDQASAGVSVVHPLYNSASAPEKRRSLLEEKESRLSVKATQTDISSAVKQTYLQLLVLRERIRLQNESLLRNEKALQDARSLLAQGRALRVDTLRAYATVKNLEPDLLRLSYAIEVGKQQLRTLTGIDSLEQIELSDSLILDEKHFIPTEEEIFNEAKDSRADLQALALQPSINDEEIKLASSAKKPVVELTGQYLIQTQARKFDYANAYYPSTPFVGVQVNIPIFSGNLNNAKIQQAKLSKKQSGLDIDNSLMQLKTETKKVVADLRESKSRLLTRVTVKETAQLSYDITQYRYQRGVASRLELTDAELALTTAQSNYLEAVYDYLLAKINLERTLGRTD